MASLESPDMHSLLVVRMPLTTLIIVEWARVFRCPRAIFPEHFKVRGSCRSVDWALASYPLFRESLVPVLPDNVEKT
jgi:hypothetical protein